MADTPEQAKAEYRQRLKQCARPLCKEDTDAAETEYLEEMRRLTGDTRVFERYKEPLREPGKDLVWEYVKGLSTARQCFNRMRHELGDAYWTTMVNSGVLDPPPQKSKFDALNKITALEGVHAYTPLVGGDPKSPKVCAAVAEVGTVCWYRFLEAFSALYGLPSVAKLRPNIVPRLPIERETINAGDFSAYEMTPAKRDAFAAKIGLTSAEWPP